MPAFVGKNSHSIAFIKRPTGFETRRTNRKDLTLNNCIDARILGTLDQTYPVWPKQSLKGKTKLDKGTITLVISNDETWPDNQAVMTGFEEDNCPQIGSNQNQIS
jgi:hypothetical protein